jgi:hypothetical protein
MEDTTINRETMGRLAKALAFIGTPQDAVVLALKRAEETGTEKDIKQARTMFMKLKPGDRRSALATLTD